jgi:hypothetical protein
MKPSYLRDLPSAWNASGLDPNFINFIFYPKLPSKSPRESLLHSRTQQAFVYIPSLHFKDSKVWDFSTFYESPKPNPESNSDEKQTSDLSNPEPEMAGSLRNEWMNSLLKHPTSRPDHNICWIETDNLCV